MKSTAPIVATLKPSIQPFEILQALVALEVGKTDQSILEYLNFFTKKIPVSATYFMHVLADNDIYDVLMEEETRQVIGEFTLEDGMLEQMEKEVKKVFKQHIKCYVEYDVRTGKPLTELLAEAKELKADLVVIGQKTGRGVHGILGKQLARETPINALIIPEKVIPSLKRILVPIDFSENSISAFETALAINQSLKVKAEISCLFIYDSPNVSSYKLMRSRKQFSKIVEENIQSKFEELLQKYDAAVTKKVKLELTSKESKAKAKYISRFARMEGMNLIVMGAKGHSRIERLLMGSVTEKLLDYNDSIPMLVVK